MAPVVNASPEDQPLSNSQQPTRSDEGPDRSLSQIRRLPPDGGDALGKSQVLGLINGRWRVTELLQGGKRIEPKYVQNMWNFDLKAARVTTRWKLRGESGYRECRFAVNVAVVPHQLTIYGENLLIQAIFEIDGDEMRMAHFGRSLANTQAARPGSFVDKHERLGPLVVTTLKQIDGDTVVTPRKLDDILNWQPKESRRRWDHDKSLWLRQLVDDLKKIKPGVSRGELEKELVSDGPTRSRKAHRYQHPRCPFIKLDVFFDVAEAELLSAERPDDKVARIEGSFVDLSSNFMRW